MFPCLGAKWSSVKHWASEKGCGLSWLLGPSSVWGDSYWSLEVWRLEKSVQPFMGMLIPRRVYVFFKVFCLHSYFHIFWFPWEFNSASLQSLDSLPASLPPSRCGPWALHRLLSLCTAAFSGFSAETQIMQPFPLKLWVGNYLGSPGRGESLTTSVHQWSLLPVAHTCENSWEERCSSWCTLSEVHELLAPLLPDMRFFWKSLFQRTLAEIILLTIWQMGGRNAVRAGTRCALPGSDWFPGFTSG